MAIYYFNVMGESDPDGTEFPSPLYARREGLKLLGALLSEEAITPRQGASCVSITDAAGTVLFELGVSTSDVRRVLAA